MAEEIQPHLFRDACVRTLGDYDSPLFCFRDVCSALGIVQNNQSRKSQKIPDDYKETVSIPTRGGNKPTLFLTEPGVYYLLMTCRSSNPLVEQFKRWLCDVVLPSLRRTGRYEARDISSDVHLAKEDISTDVQLVRLEDDASLALKAVETASKVLNTHSDDARIKLAALEMLHHSLGAVAGHKRRRDEDDDDDGGGPCVLTVSQIAESMPTKIGRGDMNKLGRAVACEYRERNGGQEPQTTMQNVGGRPCFVKCYDADDVDDWVREFVHEWGAQQHGTSPCKKKDGDMLPRRRSTRKTRSSVSSLGVYRFNPSSES